MNIIKRIGKILLSILSFIFFMAGMLYVLFYANMLIYCVRTEDYYIFDYVVIRLVIALIVVLLGIFLLFQNKIIQYFKELDARMKERERHAKVLEEQKSLREEQEETDRLEFERRFGLEEQIVEETEKERNKRYAREAWEEQQRRKANTKRALKKKATEETKRLLNENYTEEKKYMKFLEQLKEGKLNIPQFWLTVICVWVIEILLCFVGVDMNSYRGMENWRIAVMLLLVVVWLIAVAFRLRDAGKNPSLVLVCFIVPIFALIAGVFPSEGNNTDEELNRMESVEK